MFAVMVTLLSEPPVIMVMRMVGMNRSDTMSAVRQMAMVIRRLLSAALSATRYTLRTMSCVPLKKP